MGVGVYRSRLGKGVDEGVLRYLSSVGEDLEILFWDIVGSEAHVVMLMEEGIIDRGDGSKILEVLEELKSKCSRGELEIKDGYEDVHEFVEYYLIERLGADVGGRIHAGRSRNDQVSLDMRLRARELLLEVWSGLIDLIEMLLRRAGEEGKTVMMLYTHLQQAQVGLLSHYLIAVADHLFRDLQRIKNSYKFVNLCPLGASASGGSILPLSRDRVAELLGFEGLVENSLDAVGSRDWVLETVSTCSIIMTHFSRVAEDLVIWSSQEFNYVELPDELASPSSVMPHKKNPAVVELVRARAGRVIGNLIHLLTSIKSVPTGYSIDLQETKPPLFTALKHTRDSIQVMTKVFSKLIFKRDRIREAVLRSYAPAVDLAEALVKHAGLSLRESHRVVGELVKALIKRGRALSDVSLQDIEEASEKTLGRKVKLSGDTLRRYLNPESILDERKTKGSPNPREVESMLSRRTEAVMREKEILSEERRRINDALKRLESRVKEVIDGRASP